MSHPLGTFAIYEGEGLPRGIQMAEEDKQDTAAKRTARKTRPYPNASFEETLALGIAIHQHASGGPVRRLTLLEKMGRSPTSSATAGLDHEFRQESATGLFAV